MNKTIYVLIIGMDYFNFKIVSNYLVWNLLFME